MITTTYFSESINRLNQALTGSVDYLWYLQESPHWELRRDLYKAIHDDMCEICNRPWGCQLHHRHYRTLGREEVGDLMFVCLTCHKKIHEKHYKI